MFSKVVSLQSYFQQSRSRANVESADEGCWCHGQALSCRAWEI